MIINENNEKMPSPHVSDIETRDFDGLKDESTLPRAAKQVVDEGGDVGN